MISKANLEKLRYAETALANGQKEHAAQRLAEVIRDEGRKLVTFYLRTAKKKK